MGHRSVVLDTETTGLSWEAGHRIIEIGLVELIDRKRTGNVYHAYIDPEREVEEEATKIHGWDWESLKLESEGKRFRDIYRKFRDFIGDSELIIHNASFDMGFLDSELRRLGVPELTGAVKVTDTLAMARNMHPGSRANLNALAARYGIDVSHRELHGALLDAEILSDVYLALTTRQDAMLFDAKREHSVTVKTHAREAPKFTSVDASLGARLVVVTASDEELIAHEEMSNRIISKSKDEGFSL